MANPTVMIVEDEIVVAMELEEKLKNMGYQVAAIVSSGEAAVSGVDSSQPDVILMDVRLQGRLDGIQAARLIGRRSNVPIIYLTAYADDATLDRAKMTVPFGYLIKPFSEKELKTTIEIALFKHRRDKELRETAAYFAETVKLLAAALIITNETGGIKFMNHVAEVLTGWNFSEALGRPLPEIYALRDKETGGIVQNPVPHPLKMGGVSGISTNVLVSRKETEVNIESSMSALFDDAGRFSGILLTFQEAPPGVWENQDWFNLAANLYLTACLCCSDGQYSKAEALYKRALLLFEKNFGSDDQRVTNVNNDLAVLYKKMEQREMSETQLKEVL
ncbi:MAG TPA: response regulator [Desulfomonilaceae bacterium]|nr:response regulator [Desulfomonilaceae bacterium]